jgi:hypothetical protein
MNSPDHVELGAHKFLSNELFAADGTIQGVDQRLSLGKFIACALGFIPIKRSGQHLRMDVPLLDHTLAGFLQRFEPLAHLGIPCV